MAAAINIRFDSRPVPQHCVMLAGSFPLSSNHAGTASAIAGTLSTPWCKVQVAGEIVDLLHLLLQHNIAQRADKLPSVNILRFASRTETIPLQHSARRPSGHPSVPQIIPVLQLLQGKGIVKFDFISKQVHVCQCSCLVSILKVSARQLDDYDDTLCIVGRYWFVDSDCFNSILQLVRFSLKNPPRRFPRQHLCQIGSNQCSINLDKVISQFHPPYSSMKLVCELQSKAFLCCDLLG